MKNLKPLEVKKMNASKVKTNINTKCVGQPLTVEFGYTNINPTRTPKLDELDFYDNPILYLPWSFNHQRRSFIYQVIHTKSYYLKEGKRLNVSDSEISETYTKLFYFREEIAAFTHREEFDKYLFDCYLQELEQAQHERMSYQNATLFEQLMQHNSTPERVWESIEQLTKSIKSLDTERKSLFDQLKRKTITAVDFDQQRAPLDDMIADKYDLQQSLLLRYKRMVDSAKYRRRHYLKLAFVTASISLDSIFFDEVQLKLLSVCRFYVSEYCRWFNKTFKSEIAESARLLKLENRKQKRLANKKPNPRLEVLRPYLESDLSYQSIADKTNIPKSTVIRLLKEAC